MAESQGEWKAFLEEVSLSRAKNYLWLRSLSYLEYIGYRKMVKALGYEKVNKEVFHHLTDEIQHSFILKELAEKNYLPFDAKFAFSSEVQQISEDYFQKIDARSHQWFAKKNGANDASLCYLLTSYLVEKRAMRVYPDYFQCLSESPSKYLIQKIIKDETEHLSYLEYEMPRRVEFSDANWLHLLDFEDACFLDYLQRFRAYFSKLPYESI